MTKSRPCPSPTRWIHLLPTLVVLLMASSIRAKTVSGDFKLSGVNSEYILGSFAVSPGKRGTMQLFLTSGNKPYPERNQELRVHMFTDDDWPKVKKAMACVDKVPLAKQSEHVTLVKRSNGRYTAELVMSMENHKDKERSRYFYFIVDDCSLEQYMHDQIIPKMKFNLHSWDDGSHLSADEKHLASLHTYSLICSSVLAAILVYQIYRRMQASRAMHVSVLLVLLAVLADAASGFCELMHVRRYAKDGVGSYAMDALSALFESACDATIAFLLLAIGSGWTLPSDVLGHNYGTDTGGGSPMQKILAGLQSPLSAKGAAGPMPIVGAVVLAAHLILMQWGRTYDGDFDSYHDLDHRPGQILMLLRLALGAVFTAAVARTRSRCPSSLKAFYAQLWVVGGVVYFWSLPLLVLGVTRTIPVNERQFFMGFCGAALQALSLLLLSFLVAANASATSFHKVSRASGNNAQDSLTDSLSQSAEPSATKSSWNFGKSKVRMD